MDTWKAQVVGAASLLVGCTVLLGCTGNIGAPTPGESDGVSQGNTSGGVSTGTTGGVMGPVGIDENMDGIIDGIDEDGDGKIDKPIDEGMDVSTLCVPGVPGTSQLPRLTQAQYNNTIRDLVGLNSNPASLLAPDTPGSVDQRAWDGYRAAASSIAAEVMADPQARQLAIPCTTEDAACASQLIGEFGKRAYRRPLTAEEAAVFQGLYDNRAELTENGSFAEAAQLILEAFLASPSFLSIAERSETPDPAGSQYLALDGYEVASRLSYMLWGSMPDATLFAAAEAGSLSTKQGILQEAQRMLQDPKARSLVASFHDQYLNLSGATSRYLEYDRDPSKFPAFNQAQLPSMAAETARFLDYITFDAQGTFQDLLTSNMAFINADIAPLYGLDASNFGSDLTPTPLDASRPGLFTRVGFLAAYSIYDRPSSILRGAFLQKEVICTEIGAPPPDAAGTPLPMDAGLTTDRERVTAQTKEPACAGCHVTFINPTGFAMGAFDAAGQYQPMENGNPIDTTAEVPIGDTMASVSDAASLMTAIANSSAAQTCYAQRWVQYAYGRDINPNDSCLVDQMKAKLTQGGYTIQNLIADLTQSDSFRLRALETEMGQ